MFVRFAGCNLRCAGWPCDTQHAIDPERYRDEWELVDVDDLADQIAKELKGTGANNVCLTGGEPFLQSKTDLRHLTLQLPATVNVEAFTNGTIEWPDWALFRVKFIMDWKLKGSGENVTGSTPMTTNVRELCQKDAIKFTVRDDVDFIEAESIWNSYLFGRHGRSGPEVFCGPVWNLCDPRDVAKWILEAGLPWRLNVQTHKYIFGDVRGI